MNEGLGSYWGRFETREDAVAFLPEHLRSTYDNPKIVDLNVDVFRSVNLFDWPVLFYLQQMIGNGLLTSLTDFGGHVGVKYEAYCPLLDFPSGFAWQVVEVPSMVAAGRKRAGSDHPSLKFFERPEDTCPCDVLLCSGVLQYSPLTIDEIINRLPRRPKMVILSRVAVHDIESFFTIENFIDVKIPSRVFGAADIEQFREKAGYTRCIRWPIPYRDFEIPFERSVSTVNMIGEVWLNKEAAVRGLDTTDGLMRVPARSAFRAELKQVA